MRALKHLILAILIATPLTACGTIEGVGKDMSSSARWVRDRMF